MFRDDINVLLYVAYVGHIWDRGNLGRSNTIQTPGGRAGSSLSTGTPGDSSVQMFLGDKLREGEGYMHSLIHMSWLSATIMS